MKRYLLYVDGRCTNPLLSLQDLHTIKSYWKLEASEEGRLLFFLGRSGDVKLPVGCSFSSGQPGHVYGQC